MSGTPQVALVVPSLATGGAERVTVTLANALARAGADTTILVGDGPGTLAHAVGPDVRVIVFGRSRMRRALPSVVRRLRAMRPDLVVSTHTHVNLALCAAEALLPRRTRLVVREPQLPPTPPRPEDMIVAAWQRLLYRRADRVLASSSTLRDHLRTVTSTEVVDFPNPVDVVALRNGVRVPPREAGGGRLLVTVSRLSAEKGIADLLHAFADGSSDDDQLVLVGDGPERSALESLADRLSLTGRVTFAGHRDAPGPLIAAADALALTSYYEGMPNAVLEALALGTSVLATTDIRSLTDLQQDLVAIGRSDALRTVPRDALAGAIAGLPRHPVDGSPRPSLLPEAHDPARAAARLISLATT